MLVTTLFCVLALSTAVLGAWPQGFDSNWLSWRWQTCVVVGEWLYVDGGEYYYVDSNNYVYTATWNQTLSFDLSQSWTIGSVEPKVTTKPSDMMLVRRPYMWYDGPVSTVFSGSGWAYQTSESYALWSFQPDGQGGASWHISGNSNTQQFTPTFASAFTSSDISFYSLGGASVSVLNDSGLVNTTVSGLATFGFGAGAWNTQSSAGASQSGNSVFAEAVFIPNFGEQGLITFLGGESPPNSTYEYETGAALVDMSNITIYDPKTQAWYHQTATGDIPPPRAEFCAVGNAPNDNATFEIFIFGGSTNGTFDFANSADTGYTDVYVLSLPAFTWFKTNVNIASNPRRANHYCQIIANSQMLVVGGRNPSDDSLGGFGGVTDPWSRGMNIFDMSNWAWTSAYNHTAVYTRPQVVHQHYENTPNNPNWSNPTLASLFVAKPPTPPPPPSPPSPGSGSTGGSSAPSNSHTGAIVGGVVGGVVVIALILGVMICLRRRRKQRRTAIPDHPAPGYSDHAYEMAQPNQRQEQKFHELEHPPVEMHTPPVELPAEERRVRK